MTYTVFLATCRIDVKRKQAGDESILESKREEFESKESSWVPRKKF